MGSNQNKQVASGNDESTGLGWILLCLCLTTPWLIPAHTEPWPTLYSEVAAGLAIAPLAFWLLLKHGEHLEIDNLALALLLCALIPPLQALFGLYLFPAEAYLVSFYLAGIAFVVALARHAESVAPGRLAEVLLASFVVASFASVALALAQWTHLDWGPLLAAIPGGTRTVANVGQTNELSTLLIWGLIGLWWLFLRRHIGAPTAILTAATFLIGIASTQSRTAWLALGVLYLAALIAPRTIDRKGQKLAFSFLALWFTCLTVAWPMATALMNGHSTDGLDYRLAIGLRPKIWAMMLDGVRDRPWFGYGWNQGRLVQLYELPNYAELKIGVQHAHNLFIDLVVWNGLPLGILISIALCTWYFWQVRRAKSTLQTLLLLALGTFALHAMLELPHCKAFFLVPAALMMGILNAQSSLTSCFRCHRIVSVPAALISTCVLLFTWVEYQSIEGDLQTYRIRAARIGLDKPAPPSPNIRILHGLQSALLSLRIVPRSNMPTEELEALQVVSTRYPIETALFRYAKAAFLNNRPQDVEVSLRRWCQLFPEDRCTAARTAWNDFLYEHGNMAAVPFPDTQPPSP